MTNIQILVSNSFIVVTACVPARTPAPLPVKLFLNFLPQFSLTIPAINLSFNPRTIVAITHRPPHPVMTATCHTTAFLSVHCGTASIATPQSLHRHQQDSAYWEWSWDELVAFDLPAFVQFVHDQTGQNLHYVGHSLGTLIAFFAFSKNQTLNMLRSTVLLSPIAYLGQMSSTLARAGADVFLAEDLYWLGLHEFAPRGKAVVDLMSAICQMPGNDCSDLMTSFTGQNCCVNSSMTDKFLEHEPQSTSTKNMIHLAQMVRSGTITKYDYGNADANQNHYGQSTPPLYDMGSIPQDFLMYLSYGGADELSDVEDVKTLLEIVKDHDPDKLVVQFREDYAHADFVFDVNAKSVIYDPVMSFFMHH